MNPTQQRPSRPCLECPHRLSNLSNHVEDYEPSQYTLCTTNKEAKGDIADIKYPLSQKVLVGVKYGSAPFSEQGRLESLAETNINTQIQEETTKSPSKSDSDNISPIFPLSHPNICSICHVAVIGGKNEEHISPERQDFTSGEATSVISFDDDEDQFINCRVNLCLECADEVAAIESDLEAEGLKLISDNETLDIETENLDLQSGNEVLLGIGKKEHELQKGTTVRIGNADY